MPKHEDAVYVRHILESMERIQEYLRDVDEESFKEDSLRQDGVIRQLEIIGEATKQLSEELRTAHDAISWMEMAGMRDKLIHHYFGVDLEAVWEAATKDIPSLKPQIEGILDDRSVGQ